MVLTTGGACWCLAVLPGAWCLAMLAGVCWYLLVLAGACLGTLSLAGALHTFEFRTYSFK